MFRWNILWVEKNVSVVQRSVGTSRAVKINYINPFSNQYRVVIHKFNLYLLLTAGIGQLN